MCMCNEVRYHISCSLYMSKWATSVTLRTVAFHRAPLGPPTLHLFHVPMLYKNEVRRGALTFPTRLQAVRKASTDSQTAISRYEIPGDLRGKTVSGVTSFRSKAYIALPPSNRSSSAVLTTHRCFESRVLAQDASANHKDSCLGKGFSLALMYAFQIIKGRDS